LIQSRPAQESRAFHNLSTLGIEVLFPQISGTPLFSSYLFGKFSLDSLASVSGAYGVNRVVRFGKHPAEVEESVIEEIRNRLLAKEFEPKKFQRGDRVRVTSGVFDGWEGMFDCRIPGKQRAKIMLNTVFSANTTCYQVTRGAAMSLEIGLGELQPV
jgi:transcription antitermination factor NusG